MNKQKLFTSMALCLFASSLMAQAEDRLKELQARGFGARNMHVAQISAVADSVARADREREQRSVGDADPMFPGGDVFLQAYLRKKLLHAGVSGSGTVVVSFRVDAKGNIYDANVTKSAGGTLDKAAYNIVTGMPRWRPGVSNGVPADKAASVVVRFGRDEQ